MSTLSRAWPLCEEGLTDAQTGVSVRRRLGVRPGWHGRDPEHVLPRAHAAPSLPRTSSGTRFQRTCNREFTSPLQQNPQIYDLAVAYRAAFAQREEGWGFRTLRSKVAYGVLRFAHLFALAGACLGFSGVISTTI
eukprot:scaffold5558_cov131-Isochrysis_galbana.AAC.1